jgi:hypothetical protein
MARTLSLFTFKIRSGKRVLPQRSDWREGALFGAWFGAQAGRAGEKKRGAAPEKNPSPDRPAFKPVYLNFSDQNDNLAAN